MGSMKGGSGGLLWSFIMSLFQMLMGLLTLIKRFFTGSGGEGGGGAEANGDRPPPDPQSARQKRYNRDSSHTLIHV